MESQLRKPLATTNGSGIPGPVSRIPGPGSRIPGPGSKLPTGSRLKPPTGAAKRSRSPEQAPSAKRQRTSGAENKSSTIKPPTLKSSNSTGSLNSTATTKKLNTSRSGSNLKPKPAPPTSTRAPAQRVTKTATAVSTRPNVGSSTRPGAVRPGARNNVKPAVSAGPATSTTGTGTKGKPKRAAWDMKGRLQDMEEQLREMKENNERLAVVESHSTQNEQLYKHASREVDTLQKQLRDSENELYELRTQLQRDTENFEFTKGSLRRQKEALEGEISGLQQEVTGLKSSVAQLTSSQAGLKSELEATKLALDQSTRTVTQRDDTILYLKKTVEEKTSLIGELNTKCMEHETTRRKLHNTIQELKGNIRVFCRVRPLLGEELIGNDGEIHHINFPDEEQKTLELERLSEVSLSESTIGGNRNAKGKYEFNFDRVFAPNSTQESVFEEISQLVQSALDGYNVCIFAYGQTGSGKTYTMEGPPKENEETRGMISRAVLQIFSSTRQLEDKGWQYEFEASFLEIYNETIRDLLGNHGNDVKHEIKKTDTTTGGDVTVTNLTTVPVTAEHQISEMLKTASCNRAVGETKCNERSSRSHSVFRLKITGANEITGEQCKGTLNLVDLAGSERLKESGATGQRLKETQSINKSLSNLGNVIMALGNKENHVPYRNSKLTYLLQNSLGGNSKTLMFVNVSPREENFSETLNSLRFATKVNQCNIGTATQKIR